MYQPHEGESLGRRRHRVVVLPAGDDLEDQHAVAVDVGLLRELPVDDVFRSHISTAQMRPDSVSFFRDFVTFFSNAAIVAVPVCTGTLLTVHRCYEIKARPNWYFTFPQLIRAQNGQVVYHLYLYWPTRTALPSLPPPAPIFLSPREIRTSRPQLRRHRLYAPPRTP